MFSKIIVYFAPQSLPNKIAQYNPLDISLRKWFLLFILLSSAQQCRDHKHYDCYIHVNIDYYLHPLYPLHPSILHALEIDTLTGYWKTVPYSYHKRTKPQTTRCLDYMACRALLLHIDLLTISLRDS